ncbi:MAG: tRNA pseudouridine(38-40) synthase TruA, partial [Actinomycetota bacterium]|nr:tRNA pseudouridine(38-40) synthase TruA [Actinomycetota bacterium]
ARMTVAYDGRAFAGFAPNVGVRTVAGTLTWALGRQLRHPVRLTGAGRTDAGVHAWGQVVTFLTPAAGFDPGAVQRSLNALCRPAIVVREVGIAEPGFDARRSARARRYRYTILNRRVPDPFLAATTWHVRPPLDLAALRQAADPLVGRHDFTSLCRRPRVGPDGSVSLVRTVLAARWVDLGAGLLRFDIEATAFCHQMVRTIVGTLVDVGRGRRKAAEMLGIIRAQDRSLASDLAPAHGLCLWEVVY